MSWLTGNPVIDSMAFAHVGVWALLGLGFPLWLSWDRFRPQHGEHFRPVDDAPAVLESEPAPVAVRSGRSPFAPKQREAK